MIDSGLNTRSSGSCSAVCEGSVKRDSNSLEGLFARHDGFDLTISVKLVQLLSGEL